MGNTQEMIRLKLLGALQQLWDEIAQLETDLSEAAMKYSLSNSLAKKFEGWDVDCDYNAQAIWPIERPSSKKIYPDIVIHKRKKPNERLLAIEVKKFGCPPKAIKRDREYLYEYMTQLEYEHAAFVFLPTQKALGQKLENMVVFHPSLQKTDTDLDQTKSTQDSKTNTPDDSENDDQTDELLAQLNERLDKLNQTTATKKAPHRPQKEAASPQKEKTQHEQTHPKTQPRQEPVELSDQTGQEGIVNEYMLEEPESSPLIYADQLPHSPAPSVKAFFEYDPDKPKLYSLGLNWQEIEHKHRRAKEITKSLDVDGSPKSMQVEVTQAKVDKTAKTTKAKGGIFPSRIYISENVLKNQRSPDQFEHLPSPQRPTKAPFEKTTSQASENYKDN